MNMPGVVTVGRSIEWPGTPRLENTAACRPLVLAATEIAFGLTLKMLIESVTGPALPALNTTVMPASYSAPMPRWTGSFGSYCAPAPGPQELLTTLML